MAEYINVDLRGPSVVIENAEGKRADTTPANLCAALQSSRRSLRHPEPGNLPLRAVIKVYPSTDYTVAAAVAAALKGCQIGFLFNTREPD